ncbi:NADH-quinone oxidoreductase subunit NuoH [Desulfoluna spongiiphila]|uniref:NADH-quinone oxidoreductase subunit H n=1 Tax=Desulfoluna spongiiphila TaxID=419481 RepID=A0A1G5GES2_9BACT|nr:NADH-quinone oxidoreductase subunit NuoH [Desulfoluna spongiiphila]SCY50072.1 NADH dehydrogenase subunit H [Desulfoluna spongiiphila]VVS93597.1 nadh:ubiquinone oxidoreductase subunit 1/f420h2 oxidoreductase subunit h [Desulfoluna spongiiphila]
MDTMQFSFGDVMRLVTAFVLLISLVFINALVMGYLERKVAARIQRRWGPMEVGVQGWLQMVIDGVKIIAKQLIVPRDADRTIFRVAPLLSFTPVVLPFLVLPFSKSLVGRDINLGLIFVLAASSINVLSIFVAGWASNNKYSLFGAVRSVSQNIAYEIPILLSLLSVVLITNTFSMQGIVAAQGTVWFVLVQPVACLIYLISATAETNRAPFDLPEAESELTAGYHTEYSGFGFSLFMIAEYGNMFIVCAVATVLFFGGWHGPFSGEYLGALWFLLKVFLLMLTMVWVRWTYPRVRFDQLMNLAWKYLIPFSLGNLLLTALIVACL